MKNNFFKIFALVFALLLVAGSFSACGNSGASDASGEWGGINWTFSGSNGTLIISGSGEMPSAESPETVGWASVKSSVEKIIFASSDGKSITNIGDYAFYGMTNLNDINIPTEVTSIGKCAFAFCSTLRKIDMPASLVTLGESAFEGCAELGSINLPTGVTSVGARAFAFCRSLEIVLVAGTPAQIDRWTFKDCAKLNTLAVANKDTIVCAEGAFEGAAIGADALSLYAQNVVVTVYYKDAANGKELATPLTEDKKFGDSYSYTAPKIEGYIISEDQNIKQGTVGGENIELVFNYTAGTLPEATTEPEQTTEENEKSKMGTIIALVIFGVVIVGICVGVAIFIRSDKKQKKNGNTVRKSDKNAKDSKKKK